MLLPKYWGIDGVLWAGPLADALAFVLALVVLLIEVRKLKSANWQEAIA
jgi:Na+-driven multidrug efflux pump